MFRIPQMLGVAHTTLHHHHDHHRHHSFLICSRCQDWYTYHLSHIDGQLQCTTKSVHVTAFVACLSDRHVWPAELQKFGTGDHIHYILFLILRQPAAPTIHELFFFLF